MGRPVSRISCTHFAKQIVAPGVGGGGGGFRSTAWEQTEQVLDVNVSSSVPTLGLMQPGSRAELEECGRNPGRHHSEPLA